MATPIFSIRIAADVMKRLKAATYEQRTTVAELLLRPWLGDEGQPSVAAPKPIKPRSRTVVVPAKRQRVEAAKAVKGRVIGYAADGSEIRR